MLLIVGALFLITFVIKAVRWNYYHNNTEIKSEAIWVKLSADRIIKPEPDTYYYTRTKKIDTVRAGIFPLLSVKTSYVSYGIWKKASTADGDPNIIVSTVDSNVMVTR